MEHRSRLREDAMAGTVSKTFGERMAWQIGMTATVDPDEFRDLCEEMEVWQEEMPSDLYNDMAEAFGADAHSAVMRFLDLSESLNDGTLAEFQCSTDEDEVETPYAIFEAAAVVPLDEETSRLDRPAWFEEIMRRLAHQEDDDSK